MDNQFLDEGLQKTSAEPVELTMATQGKRFGTYVIDRIFSYIFAIFIAGAYFAMNPDNAEKLVSNSGFERGADLLFGYLSLLIYYTIFETLFKGRTIGKMICGTRAVTDEGQIMDFGTVLKRTFCRMVPFDALSYLGGYAYGWHDKWSDTMVVNENEYQAFSQSM